MSLGVQAIGKEVLIVGYLMKPSREEDFAKVSPLSNMCSQNCEVDLYKIVYALF